VLDRQPGRDLQVDPVHESSFLDDLSAKFIEEKQGKQKMHSERISGIPAGWAQTCPDFLSRAILDGL
jgi:hypothetical protein